MSCGQLSSTTALLLLPELRRSSAFLPERGEETCTMFARRGSDVICGTDASPVSSLFRNFSAREAT